MCMKRGAGEGLNKMWVSRQRVFIVCTVLLISFTFCTSYSGQERWDDTIWRNRLDDRLRETVELAITKYTEVAKDSYIRTKRYPRDGRPNKQKWDTVPVEHWAAGFLPGVFWQLYRISLNRMWADHAIRAQKNIPLRGRSMLGLTIMASFGEGFRAGYGKQKGSGFKETIIQAAKEFTSNYMPNAGVMPTRGFKPNPRKGRPGNPVESATVANLDLLFMANHFMKNKTMLDIATKHASKSKDFLRKDGSSFHILSYHQNGDLAAKYNLHGLRDSSCYTTAHAWFILGMVESFHWTGDTSFLVSAKSAADFLIKRLPEDNVPHWDLDAVQGWKSEPRDTSGGAIAACALLKLYAYTGERKYFDKSEDIIEGIIDNYSASGFPIPAISINGTGFHGDGKRECAIIWGDYYLLKYVYEYLKFDKAEHRLSMQQSLKYSSDEYMQDDEYADADAETRALTTKELDELEEYYNT